LILRVLVCLLFYFTIFSVPVIAPTLYWLLLFFFFFFLTASISLASNVII